MKASGAGLSNPTMNKETILGIIAVLAILGAASVLIVPRRESKLELGPYQALGTVAAEETMKLLADRDQVVVVAQDTREFELPALAAQLKAFQASARRNAKVTVSLERITMDAMTMMSTGGRVPGESFLHILGKHPKAGAIVLFLGYPQLSKRDVDAVQLRSAKIVVVAAYRAEYPELLERRLIDLAIVPRSDNLPDAAGKPRTLREWFDQEYVILGPAKTAASPR